MVAVLHGLAVGLGFHYAPLFRAASVVATIPGQCRLAAMGGEQLARLAEAYAAARHYEGLLLRRMVGAGRARGGLAGHGGEGGMGHAWVMHGRWARHGVPPRQAGSGRRRLPGCGHSKC